uniref:Plakophilin 1a n=1 Tax=Nothobranchius kuhntae TaxID=321403 RepID=A0A1A8IVG1_NOTKU
MMVSDTLRSGTIRVGNAEDTSLALPSDKSLSSGQQRVLTQVHSIKRSKSKQSSNGASPTSPNPTSLPNYNEFGTFRFKSNGVFTRNSSMMTSGYTKGMKSRSLSTKEKHISTSANISMLPKKPNGLKSSISDPALAPFSPALASTTSMKGQYPLGANKSSSSIANGMIHISQTCITQPRQFQSEEQMKTARLEQESMVNSVKSSSDMTLPLAVKYLSVSDENCQLSGAKFIQHATYTDEGAKTEVLQLDGIAQLVTLLENPNPKLNQAAAGALRNLVFKNQDNKLKVQECAGIGKALQLLQKTNSVETQRQITGLLWNLSSDDKMKNELTKIALPSLTKHVIVPYTTGSDSNGVKHVDQTVFLYATSVMRNLSSSSDENRQEMRACPGFIDSLFSYIDSCVAEEKYDEKALENCAAVFQNLTYKLERCQESTYNPPRGVDEENAKGKKSSTVGCFSPRSSKVQAKQSLKSPQESSKQEKPSGVNLLFHDEAIRHCLTLIEFSKNRATQEACCGTLQNISAGGGIGSSTVSQIFSDKGKITYFLPSMLSSENKTLQASAVAMMSNVSRISGLQPIITKEMMLALSKLITSGVEEMGNSDQTVTGVCSTMNRLMLADSEGSKKVINPELVQAITSISLNENFVKGSKAASLLLYSMWKETNLRSFLKKQGMNKDQFVNDRTKEVNNELVENTSNNK